MPTWQRSSESFWRKRSQSLLFAPLAAALLIGVLALLMVSGGWPEFRGLVGFSDTAGVVSTPPSQIARVEIYAGRDIVALHRDAADWMIDGSGAPLAVPADIASHLDVALRFLHASEPAREIPANELTPASFAEFGLDPPASVVVLGTAARTVTTVSFGVLNPAGTSQYVRLGGAATVYLLPRHVGNEWQVAGDMVRRLRGQTERAAAGAGTSLLLPMSMARVWAVEIVYAGKLTRFERDTAGNWFRHTGQHSHASGANAHVADPAQARLIAAALEAFGQTTVESRAAPAHDEAELARFGLALPPIIVLLYARDSSTPLARLELGATADSFGRYARLAPNGDVVTIAQFEAQRLTALLKAVGAGS